MACSRDTKLKLGWVLVAMAVASFGGLLYLLINGGRFASLCAGILFALVFILITYVMGTAMVCCCVKDVLKSKEPASSAKLLSGDAQPSSGANPTPEPATQKRILKVAFVLGCGLSVLGFIALWAGVGVLSAWDNGTQPNLTEKLTFPGLTSEVTVVHEASGMFHIIAENDHDVHFAQGVVHAQYRLWQMEFQRRLGNASLAAIAGSPALTIDKQMAMLGLYERADAAFPQLSASSQAIVMAYTDGINAYLNSNPNLPWEFTLLGYKPAPWRPADSLVWAKIMSLDLSCNLDSEMARYELHTQHNISMARIHELMPSYEADRFPTVLQPDDIQGAGALPPGQSGPQAQQEVDPMTEEWMAWARGVEQSAEAQAARKLRDAAEAEELAAAEEEADICSPSAWFKLGMRNWLPAMFRKDVGTSSYRMPWRMGASNNWVVGGNLTKTGLPLLCNDPHLSLTAPSIWILNHLQTNNDSAIGSSFPGLPGVVIGRNNHIAWGVTNTGADVQDLYIMKGNFTHYENNGMMLPYRMVEHVLEVKGEAPVHMTVRHSKYGPVVNDNGLFAGSGAVPLSLSWTSILPDLPDTTMDAFLSINKARSWDEYRAALQSYVAPSQNFIFAHTEGDIGYQMPGKIPRRSLRHTGAYPVPGNGSFDWQGYLGFDELPRSHNPTPGFVASANNKVTPDNYKYIITEDWDSGSVGYRAKRITDLIHQRDDHDKDTMKAIQLDYTSYLAQDFAGMVPEIPDHLLTAGGLQIKNIFKTWDHTTPIGDTTTTLFEKWWVALTTLAGPETGTTHWDNAAYNLNALKSDSSRKGTDKACKRRGYPTCLAFAAAKLNEVAAKVLDGDLSDVPQWGLDLHQAEFKSQLLGTTAVGCMANRFTPHGGDQSTVNVGHFSKKSFVMVAGPSYRQVIDMSDPDSSWFLNPLGQDGNEFSSNYDNLLVPWTVGTYLPMTTSNFVNDGSFNQTMAP